MSVFHELRRDAAMQNKWQQHKFIILIAAVLVTSCALITVAMHLYATSGASQVDISKPSLQSVREQAAEEAKKSTNDAFSANGKLDNKALADFNRSFSNHVNQIDPANHYTPDAVSPENLQLFVDPTTIPQQ